MSEALAHHDLEAADRFWVNNYRSVNERYKRLPIGQSTALQGLRLLCLRWGFGELMKSLRTRGLPWVATRVRDELIQRQDFLLGLRMRCPAQADNEAPIELRWQDLATELASPDMPYLMRLLDRLRVSREGRPRTAKKRGSRNYSGERFGKPSPSCGNPRCPFCRRGEYERCAERVAARNMPKSPRVTMDWKRSGSSVSAKASAGAPGLGKRR